MSMAENEGGEGGSEEKMEVDDKDQDYSEVGHAHHRQWEILWTSDVFFWQPTGWPKKNVT